MPPPPTLILGAHALDLSPRALTPSQLLSGHQDPCISLFPALLLSIHSLHGGLLPLGHTSGFSLGAGGWGVGGWVGGCL